MSWLKDNKIFIGLIYLNLLLILKLIKVCYLITNFNYLYVSGIFLGAVLFYWFFHSVLKNGTYRAIFILCILACFLYLYFAKLDYLKDLYFNHILYTFESINNSIFNSIPVDFNTFKLIMIIIMPVIIIAIMALTTWGLYNSVIVFTLISIIFLWYTGYTEEVKAILLSYTFLTMITYCINIYVKNTRKLIKKGYKVGSDLKKVIAYGMILCIVISLVSNILPQNFEGKYVSDLRSRFQNKFIKGTETNEQKGRKLKYDIVSSGYGGKDGKLGGPITLNKLIAFNVKSDKPYYLRGSVKDFYDGFSWSRADDTLTRKDNSEQNVFKDTFSYDYVDSNSKNKITIYPSVLNSSTLFAPLYTANINLEQPEIYYDTDSTFINGGVVKKPYDVEFYNISFYGQTILNKNKASNRTVGAAFYLEKYKKYLQLPDNISPATYDLVYNLTKDCKNELEKVEKIKNYLSANYPYTLKVSAVPEGHEFVDYFLFTEKKGYCVYFATATTIMCRIAGIPARYVEGYNMTTEKDSDGLYIVREESAHAWTEVLYMQNQNSGLWQTVDAVPNATELVHKEQEEASKAVVNVPGSSNPNNQNKGTGKKEQGYDETGGGQSGTDSINKISPKMLILIYILAAFTAFVLIRILTINLKRYRMIRARSVIPLFIYSTRRLESIRIKKSNSIGDMEFAETIRNEALREKMVNITKAAYEEYYGDKRCKDFEKKKHYNFIERYIRRNQNVLMYFIKRIFFIRIFPRGKKSNI